jgi:hypothetical protein
MNRITIYSHLKVFLSIISISMIAFGNISFIIGNNGTMIINIMLIISLYILELLFNDDTKYDDKLLRRILGMYLIALNTLENNPFIVMYHDNISMIMFVISGLSSCIIEVWFRYRKRSITLYNTLIVFRYQILFLFLPLAFSRNIYNGAQILNYILYLFVYVFTIIVIIDIASYIVDLANAITTASR